MIPSVRQIHTKLYIGSSDGITWLDLSDHFIRAAVNKGDVTQLGASGVDGVIASADFSLRRRGPVYTLDPGSSPILFPNREIMLRVAITAPGVEPSSWVTLFHGLLGDSISYSDTTVDLTCRDMAKLLGDCYIEEVQQYGSDEGVPLETVLQQIIDVNLGVGEALVYCPVSPGFMITPYQLEHKSVWDAIQEAVGQAGCFIGYRWDSGTGQYRLTLLEPERDKDASTADFAFTSTDDIIVEQLDISDKDIRNAVKVTWRDKATGQRRSVTVVDELSIAQFRRRAMQIEEADTSLIDTEAEARRLADAALADLSQLTSTNRIEMPLLPELDIMHGITVTNPRMSEDQTFYGVESVRHTIDYGSNKFRTEVIASGRVIGGHGRWLRMQTRPGSPGEPDYPLPVTDVAPDTPIWDTCEFVRNVTLRWHPVTRAVEYEIRRVDADWGTELGRVWHGTETTAVIAPQSRSETFYLRARDAGGHYSQTSAVITVTNDTPSTPAPPVVTEFFSALWITINPVADNDIVSYNLYMTPVDEEGDPTGDTQVTTYLNAGRVTYNASPGTRFKIEVAAADVLGEGGKSTPVYAETTDLDEITVPDWVREPIENISEKWVVDTDEDGNLIGLVRVEDGEQHSHIAVLADVFSIATPEGRKPVFVFDTQEKKLYILGDLIAEGLIRATEIQSELAKHLLLQAQLATVDEADVLWLRADKITVGGSAPGIPLTKPEGAHLWHFDGSLVSTDGISPESGAVATLRPDGRFGGAVAVEVGTTNLANNPTFSGAVGTTPSGWHSDVTIQQDDFFGQLINVAELLCVSGNAYEDFGTGIAYPLAYNTTYTISFWARGTMEPTYELSTGRGIASATWKSKPPMSLQWQRYEVTIVTASSGSIYPFWWVLRNVNDVNVGKWVRIARIQLEQKPFATSFVDGTRAAGKLEYEVTYGERGTLSWWMTGSSATTATDAFTLGTGNTITQLSGAGSKLSWAGLDCSLDISPQDWLYCVATWDRVSGDRSLTVHNLTQGVNASATATDADTLAFGSTLSYGGANLADVRYDEVMLWNHAATPEQIQAWYDAGVPFTEPLFSAEGRMNADLGGISAAGNTFQVGRDGAAQYDGSGVKRVHMGHLAGLEWKGQQLPQGTYGFWAPDGRIAVSSSQVYQVDDETGTSTTSAYFVDVPGMELNLTVSESVLCLLQCSFTGEAVSNTYNYVAAYFRLTSNGSEIPATMRFIDVGPFGGEGGRYVSVPVAMNTILTLTPGTYSIKLQFMFFPRSVFQEGQARVYHRTLSALVLRC